MTRKNKKELAQKIKIYMLKKGITQRALAQKLKVTPAAISSFLSGENALRTDTLIKIATALGTDANYFFDNSTSVKGNHNILSKSVGEGQNINLQKELQLIKQELEIHRYKLENLELKMNKIQKK